MSDGAEKIREALRFPRDCSEEVSRRGELQPCERMGVALRIDIEEGAPYVVCAYHSRGQMVPLTWILESLTAGADQ